MTNVEEIAGIVRRALDDLPTDIEESRGQWTRDVKVALGVAGREHDFWVCAGGIRDNARDSGEWLYDVTWLSYLPDGEQHLVDADLVVECEWDPRTEYVDEDFQKLLLARATVRLMIFDGGDPEGADVIASHLARQVAAFRRSRDDDAWLFAAWVGDESDQGWSFRWYTVRQGKADLQGVSYG